MMIRKAEISDRESILELYERSQLATGLPDPEIYPPNELIKNLYNRRVIERFVAVEAGRIVGHALIEEPNPVHQTDWLDALSNPDSRLIEMGGAFVDPTLARQGIWTSLLLHRINLIKNNEAFPVTATWSVNVHVKRTFKANGGVHAGVHDSRLGVVDLFVFPMN
jgi:N-acetylglutamate synthase-like GNAT family acetyltransferase